ncbi:MAG: AgmX/PglI C-terminal domain-containing protein, partial [Myxococcales bacterium]|nr:AgmX/PglI C-terminal domain-containing protein [Myxococcales bacterium]
SAANQLAARTICGPDAFCGQPPLPTATGPAAIQEILQSQAAAYRKCYAAGLAKKPDLTGSVNIRLSIRKDGSVESASGQGSKLPDPTVIACIEKAIASLRFPASDATSSITYPISFASAGGARATASTAQPIDRAPAVPGAFVQSKGPVCVARAKKGDACAYTRGCADGLVCADNLCVDPPAATLSCRADRDCDLASRCRELATGRRCVPLRRNGESCESPEDCAGAACQKGVCTGPCGP